MPLVTREEHPALTTHRTVCVGCRQSFVVMAMGLLCHAPYILVRPPVSDRFNACLRKAVLVTSANGCTRICGLFQADVRAVCVCVYVCVCVCVCVCVFVCVCL